MTAVHALACMSHVLLSRTVCLDEVLYEVQKMVTIHLSPLSFMHLPTC